MKAVDQVQQFNGDEALTEFGHWTRSAGYSGIEVLVDEHTHKWCFPRFVQKTGLSAEPLVVPPGEESKSVTILTQLWRSLLDRHADRRTLLINLGGGVITDLGGFVASTYKRGIPFAHIPTSLLGQVDAAIGHKTGIDFGDVKNSVGTFSPPEALVLDSGFLDTLPGEEMRSGMAEVLKHGLIRDALLWRELANGRIDGIPGASVVQRAAEIKMEVVREDPREKGLRKILNFGHSLGHAAESAAMIAGAPVRHGDAVAAGMLMEAWLSHEKGRLSDTEWVDIRFVLTQVYPPLPLDQYDQDRMVDILRHDKKNRGSSIRIVLLEQIGRAVYDQEIDVQDAIRAFQVYPSFYES